jgi:transcriptional regulator with XRE-family HTH domain
VKYSARERNSMLSPIKTNISQKLRDKRYRDAFFRGRGQDEIAHDLRRFRKERGLNQGELARLCGMKQSAISRIEQASYSKWNFTTLWRIARALDVRVRVTIEDAKEAVREYERRESLEQDYSSSVSPVRQSLSAEVPNVVSGHQTVTVTPSADQSTTQLVLQ